MLENAQWIWADAPLQADQYAEFYLPFSFLGCPVSLQISADSNYAVYVNGALADSGQYPDFPWYKVYDQLDLTPLCRKGENHLAILVWHYGKSNMSYYPGKAGLLFALSEGKQLLCASSPAVSSRISPAYENGRCQNITSQLGFGYAYDLNKEDGWMLGQGEGFKESVIVEQSLPLFPRPVKKCLIGEPILPALIKEEKATHFLYDLGREEAGYLTLDMVSPAQQKVHIMYGEHILDGGVRTIIGNRNFSVDITLRPGENSFTNPLRRLGGRYLEVEAEAPLEIRKCTLLPTTYPLDILPISLPDPLDRKIYDTAVRTLHLCMHDHYEDTPWREQALYAMDSRNQILCGYYAFKEFQFPRANLLLMSKDDRPDGLLSICTPSADDLTIPSFSLHYFAEVWEYTKYSGDLSLAEEVYPKLEAVLRTFTDHMENDLVPIFTKDCHWNFYEWAPGLEGTLRHAEEKRLDCALNCLLSLALQAMEKISQAIGKKRHDKSLINSLNAAIRKAFYDESRALFVNSTEDDRASELVNALAILCGAAPDEQALAEKLQKNQNEWIRATLSMMCFKYDALLKVDRERYKPYILENIRDTYKKMLDQGATSFWETENGADTFGRAGSLCHGWSAMPVYYYHILNS